MCSGDWQILRWWPLPINNAEQLDGFSVGREPWVAMMSKDHPLAAEEGQFLPLRKLVGQPLYIPSRRSRLSDLIVTKIITESARQVEYALVWKRNDRQTELQQEFINYVQDCMEEERRGTQPYIMPEREYFPPEDTKYL